MTMCSLLANPKGTQAVMHVGVSITPTCTNIYKPSKYNVFQAFTTLHKIKRGIDWTHKQICIN